MQRVTSADGTAIAYERHGPASASTARPPVVCLHGTGVTRHVWTSFLGQFDGDVPLVVPDRRGRGDSGDADEWTVGRELDDTAALVGAEADETVTLFGSSFGGLLALRAAERLPVDSLVLYEPPMPAATVEGEAQSGFAAEIDRRVEAGNREDAVRFFFEEATGATDVERWPIWPDCIDLAETIARECHVVESFDPGDCSVSAPTLLFRGRRSLPYLQAGIDVLEGELPDTRVVEVDAGHAGVATASGQVAAAVEAFLG